MFKIGEKVVCINPSSNLIKGQIYTVIYYSQFSDSILVAETQPTKNVYFWGNRFRKLDYEFADNLLAEISEAMKQESILN
jgi:methyl coenzyme M reductase gamma subunit